MGGLGKPVPFEEPEEEPTWWPTKEPEPASVPQEEPKPVEPVRLPEEVPVGLSL